MSGLLHLPKNENIDLDGIKKKQHSYYGQRKADIIFVIYVVSIILWAILIIYLDISISGFGLFILFLPFITFFISMMSIGYLSRQSEASINSSLFITAGLVITVPLLTVIARDFNGDREKMINIIVVAVTLALLSIIDIWVPYKWTPVIKHIKSIFQTGFFTLILFTIYYHYETTGLSTNKC